MPIHLWLTALIWHNRKWRTLGTAFDKITIPN